MPCILATIHEKKQPPLDTVYLAGSACLQNRWQGLCEERARVKQIRFHRSRLPSAGAVLLREWSAHKDSNLEYSNGTTWERMLQQGIQLIERLAQDDRIRIREPRVNLQVKFTRPLPKGNNFVADVDAIGPLDSTRCLLEWKTTSSLYPEAPQGPLLLDPQLVCYSWITGISDVAQIVFVRKIVEFCNAPGRRSRWEKEENLAGSSVR